MTTEKTARVGSIVLIDIPNGQGRHGQEYKEVKAKVHMVLPTHLVCRLLSDKRGANPRVAESYKLVRW